MLGRCAWAEVKEIRSRLKAVSGNRLLPPSSRLQGASCWEVSTSRRQAAGFQGATSSHRIGNGGGMVHLGHSQCESKDILHCLTMTLDTTIKKHRSYNVSLFAGPKMLHQCGFTLWIGRSKNNIFQTNNEERDERRARATIQLKFCALCDVLGVKLAKKSYQFYHFWHTPTYLKLTFVEFPPFFGIFPNRGIFFWS